MNRRSVRRSAEGDADQSRLTISRRPLIKAVPLRSSEPAFRQGGSPCRFVCALVSLVSALLPARHATGGRTGDRGGCQLHMALGAGLCTRTEQTLPSASQADQQELSD